MKWTMVLIAVDATAGTRHVLFAGCWPSVCDVPRDIIFTFFLLLELKKYGIFFSIIYFTLYSYFTKNNENDSKNLSYFPENN
jgi:hypothetical protein